MYVCSELADKPKTSANRGKPTPRRRMPDGQARLSLGASHARCGSATPAFERRVRMGANRGSVRPSPHRPCWRLPRDGQPPEWASTPGRGNWLGRRLEVLDPDSDSTLPAAIRREGAGGDPSPDCLARDRHNVCGFFQAEVHGDGTSLSHRNPPPSAWLWRRRGSVWPPRR